MKQEDHPDNDAGPVLILGAGDMAVQALDELPPERGRIAGFVEEQRGEGKKTLEGLPVYGLDDLREMAATHRAIAWIGEPSLRRRMVERVEAFGLPFITMAHPQSSVRRHARVGDGTIVGPFCIVFQNARVGRHCMVLSHTVVGHHAVIEDFATVVDGVRVGGHVRIGEGAFVGQNVCLREGISIGRGAVVGAGAVVIRDVPENVTVAGNPARVIGEGGPVFGRDRR